MVLSHNDYSSTIPLSVATAVVPEENKDEVVHKQPAPLRRVVSGAALKNLLAGSAGQPKTPTTENP
ncbi:hypothetical protein EV182_006145, partial [Spiromyces aspiralis]